MSIFIFATTGIGLAVLYNVLVIRNFPEPERKPGYIVTVVIFFLLALILFGTFSARSMINSAIKTYSSKLEKYIMDNHSNSNFVKNGLDLAGISEDIPRLNNAIAELNSVLPSHSELGVPKVIYDSATNHVIKQLQSSLTVASSAGGAANIFANENNRLTLLSILNGVQIVLMKIVNIITVLIVIVVAILLAIYIIWSLFKVSKKKRREITH